MRYLLIALLTALPLSAQVVVLSGGDSSIQNGFGAGATLYFPNSTSSIGGGEVNGRLAFSALDTFDFRGNTVSVGQTPFGFQVAGSGAFVMETGIQVRRDRQNQTIAAFVGSTGLGASVAPFFTGGLTQHIGTGFFYRRKVKRLEFSNLSVMDGGQRTQIDGVAWQGAKLSASAAGGVLMGSRFTNGQLTYSPTHALQVYAFRQDSFIYFNRAYQQFTSNSVGVATGFGRYNAGASVNDGTFQGKHVIGESAHAGVRVSILSLDSGAYLSAGRSTVLFHTLTAQVMRRFSVQATISQNLRSIQQAASTAYSGGFSWNTNWVTLSVSQSIAFAPWLQGFQKVESVSLAFKIPHSDATLRAGFNSGFLGNKFSLGGEEYIQGPLRSAGGVTQHYARGGKYSVRGTVVDEQGEPVIGASLQIGTASVMTNSKGQFELRCKKTNELPVTVALAAFASGEWSLVSAPAVVAPTLEGTQIAVVVKRA